MRKFRAEPGVWGFIHVVRGTVRYQIVDADQIIELTPDLPGVVKPDAPHYFALSDDSDLYVEFLR